MNNYLIADYILGYSLSNNSFFSARDIAMELCMPASGIATILMELCRLNKDWFEIMPASDKGELKITRRKEYDEAIIAWLINGESKNHFKDIIVADSYYYPIKRNPGKNAMSSVQSVMRVIAFISTREIIKDRKWVLKNIISIKNVIKKAGKR